MTKWFDTNYHYMVPELQKDQTFTLASRKPIEEYQEAKALGYQTRPVLVGPVTFLKLAKCKDAGVQPAVAARPAAAGLCRSPAELAKRGAEWVQIDEPCLVLDLDDHRAAGAAARLCGHSPKAVPELKIMLTTYFGGLGDNLDTALALPVAGLHLDLVRAPEQFDDSSPALRKGPDAVARRHRRPQHLAGRSEPRCSTGSNRWSPSSAPTASRSRRPARCSTSRSTSNWKPISIPT